MAKSKAAKRTSATAQDRVGHTKHEEEQRAATPADPNLRGFGERPDISTANLKLIQRAIKRRFPTEPVVLEAILNRVAHQVLNTTNERNLFAGARVYFAAERMNQIDELSQSTQNHLHLHAHAGASQDADPADRLEQQRIACLRAISAELERRRIDRRDAGVTNESAGSDSVAADAPVGIEDSLLD